MGINFDTDLLLPLDPVRGLQILRDDIQRFSELDPKIREAMSLLQDRFGDLTEEEQASLAPVLWMHVRDGVQRPYELRRLRRAVRNGSFLLAAVEAALNSMLQADSLKRAAVKADTLARESPYKSKRVDDANNELAVPSPEAADLELVVVLAGVGIIIWAAATIVSDIDAYEHPIVSHS
jgi:hypothetical protein